MIFEIAVITFLGVYLYVKWKFTYWKKRGLPFQEPNFPFGSYGMPTRSFIHPAEIVRDYYNHFKSLGHKHFGVFLSVIPVYIPIHPEIVKKILVQDFNHFHSRGFYYNAKIDPLSASFTFLKGQEWKIRRQKLTSLFSSGKIKMQFEILNKCSEQFVSALAKLSENKEPINIRQTIDCLSINIMATSAFGFECKSFEDKNNELQKYGRKYFKALSPIQILKWMIAYANKGLAHFLRITLLPKDVTDFFFNVIRNTVKIRESTNFHRPDMIQQLIELKDKGIYQPNENVKITLTEYEMMMADAFLLNILGADTTSNLMSFCLFELAVDADIQQKIRDEISRVTEKDNGKITYDNLMNMKYLDQVLNESSRKYPAAPLLSRLCTEDYKVPSTNVTIEKGTYAVIPILAIHHDPEYFPNPEKFDPERFSDLNKGKIPPFTYLPFGEGPRTCLAGRFGFIATKLAIAAMVKNISFTLNEKTSPFPRFDPLNHSFSFKNLILMDIKKL